MNYLSRFPDITPKPGVFDSQFLYLKTFAPLTPPNVLIVEHTRVRFPQ